MVFILKVRMIMRVIEKVFQGLSTDMKIKNKISGMIKHKAEKGRERESIVIDFMRNCLPKNFFVNRGFIVSYDNKQSPQEDVVIYDEFSIPIIAHFSQNQLFPIESVYAIIEVKSSLNKTELEKSVKNIKFVKEMPISGGAKRIGMGIGVGQSPPPIGVVFAFQSTRLETLTNNLSEFNKDIDPGLWASLICVLDKGVIFYGDREKMTLKPEPNPSMLPVILNSGENALLDFYILLEQFLNYSPKKIVSMMAYYMGKPSSPIQNAINSMG